MKIFVILTVLFFLGIFSVTNGLECYVCAQMDGGPGEKDCEVSPPDKYIQTCNFGPPGTTAVGDPVCTIGTHKLNGYKVIQRGCRAAEVDGNLDGVCITTPDQCYPNIGCFLGTKTRHCTSDKCNGFNVSDSDECNGMPNGVGHGQLQLATFTFTILIFLGLGISSRIFII